ncbi:pentapeptide repeat-containing protein [Nostoc sp. 'Peltigera membranacea cyanobiont' N6]|uniref:pentapeptide repeat-containing protein n=1 Tax=Nostoc sp. 'Peltigera membranacea cyanobiont' N6 TaxID=1261031 RepID=UPI000CF348B4|nr:pentapeptide repeat-containing protein [Nostoc sp. 'Peltigera membranacea cyanobiont' N6]
MEKITAEMFLKRYENGCRDFQSIILEYADLSMADFQRINLQGSQFSYVNLSRINLRDSTLTAQFSFCNFRDSKIESCYLESARFSDCDFRGASVTKVNLTYTSFIRVNLQGARLEGFGEEFPLFFNVVREDGEFIPGYTYEP